MKAWGWILVLAGLGTACTGSVDVDPRASSGRDDERLPEGGGSGQGEGAGGAVSTGAGAADARGGAPLGSCGGVTCASDEICNHLDLACGAASNDGY